MSASGSKSAPAVGFLTVTEHGDFGLLGGYLVLNTSGRPLEFHCTAPVRANRAQEILYGPTLKPYLYGEQIGQTLVDKAKTKPFAVCTDVLPALALREHSAVPLLYLPGGGASSSEGVGEGPAVESFDLGGRRAGVPARYSTDIEGLTRHFEQHEIEFDLDEPFQRIREAIEEAQKSRKAA